MATKPVDFTRDLPAVRKYFAARVRAQAKVGKPVGAIEVGFQLCQAGLVVLHFDVRARHDRDGEWTRAMAGPVLDLPHWCRAYEAAEERGASFVLLDGKPAVLKPGASDGKVAGVFGKALLAIARDTIAAGAFDALPLRENCQLDVDEFDGMWAWPARHADVGRTNVVGRMRAARLPG